MFAKVFDHHPSYSCESYTSHLGWIVGENGGGPLSKCGENSGKLDMHLFPISFCFPMLSVVTFDLYTVRVGDA